MRCDLAMTSSGGGGHHRDTKIKPRKTSFKESEIQKETCKGKCETGSCLSLFRLSLYKCHRITNSLCSCSKFMIRFFMVRRRKVMTPVAHDNT